MAHVMQPVVWFLAARDSHILNATPARVFFAARITRFQKT